VTFKRTTTAIAALGLALIPAGCGGDEEGRPVPASLREQLESRLEEAEDRLEAEILGACEDIQNDTEPEVDRVLAQLPSDVDSDIRQQLEDGFSRLWELVSDECDRLREEQETEPETTPPPAPEPLPEETETETTPTVPEPAPEEEEGGGGDEGGGGGGGGGGTPGGGGGGGGSGGDGLPEVPGSGGGGAVPGTEG
jgi:hypothetical protein